MHGQQNIEKKKMSKYVYAMPCYAMPRYTMLYHSIPYYTTLHYSTLHYIILVCYVQFRVSLTLHCTQHTRRSTTCCHIT